MVNVAYVIALDDISSTDRGAIVSLWLRSRWSFLTIQPASLRLTTVVGAAILMSDFRVNRVLRDSKHDCASIGSAIDTQCGHRGTILEQNEAMVITGLWKLDCCNCQPQSTKVLRLVS